MKPVPPAFRIAQKRGLREGKITKLSDSVEKKENTPERNARIVRTPDSRKSHLHPKTKSRTPETFKIQYRSLNYTDPLKKKAKRNNVQRHLVVIESAEVWNYFIRGFRFPKDSKK